MSKWIFLKFLWFASLMTDDLLNRIPNQIALLLSLEVFSATFASCSSCETCEFKQITDQYRSRAFLTFMKSAILGYRLQRHDSISTELPTVPVFSNTETLDSPNQKYPHYFSAWGLRLFCQSCSHRFSPFKWGGGTIYNNENFRSRAHSRRFNHMTRIYSLIQWSLVNRLFRYGGRWARH